MWKLHSGLTIDLLAELGNGNDENKKVELRKILNNENDNIINQNSKVNEKKYRTNLACGDVAMAAGMFFWGENNVYFGYDSYHKRISSGTKKHITIDMIEYDKTLMQSKVAPAIKHYLSKGVSVRVGVVHWDSRSPGNRPPTRNDAYFNSMLARNGALQPDKSGGHFVLIVGCDDTPTKFLYLDPWDGGSILLYTGGDEKVKHDTQCNYMGIFTLQEKGEGLVLRKGDRTGGSMDYEVIAGPTHDPPPFP